MTGDQNKERSALDRLADALVDDILYASDEEVLAEAEEDGIDPAEFAGHLRDVFQACGRGCRERAKLAAARQGAASAQAIGRARSKDRSCLCAPPLRRNDC